MKNLEKIIGKKAYWGMHTFEATKDIIDGEDVVRIEVYRNVPRKYETTFFIQSREQLLDDSGDETKSLRFFTGNFKYIAVDDFIEAFRHDL